MRFQKYLFNSMTDAGARRSDKEAFMNKLMVFGDSIFKGVTYSDEKKRYIICRHDYADKLAGEGIVTENYSKMGATVNKIEEILDRKQELIDDDTTVLFEFGGNDSDYNWAEVSEAPFAEHNPKTLNNNFASMYGKLIQKVKNMGANVVVSNLIPLDADKYMEWISAGKNYDNIMKFLGDISMLYRWQEYYNFTVERIAEQNDCPILDVRHSFLVSHDYKSIICSDGLHPTPAGHNIIDNAVYDFIQKYKGILWRKRAVC